jgi:hypothetical protein
VISWFQNLLLLQMGQPVYRYATAEVNEDLRSILLARAQGIADLIAERALAHAWREEVADTIVKAGLYKLNRGWYFRFRHSCPLFPLSHSLQAPGFNP